MNRQVRDRGTGMRLSRQRRSRVDDDVLSGHVTYEHLSVVWQAEHVSAAIDVWLAKQCRIDNVMPCSRHDDYMALRTWPGSSDARNPRFSTKQFF